MESLNELTSRGRIVFSATVPLGMRPAVEALFFFNPQQSLLRDGIYAAIGANRNAGNCR